MSYESLSHSKWDCKYHIVFITEGRKKVLYGTIRKFLGSVFHELTRQRGSEIGKGHMVADHVHMLIKIPPKYAVAEVMGYIRGKSAITVAMQFGGRKRNFNGEQFWARGYAVSTVGFEEEQMQKYIRHQETLDTKGYDQKEENHEADDKDDGHFYNTITCGLGHLWGVGWLTTVKLPALRGRYNYSTMFRITNSLNL